MFQPSFTYTDDLGSSIDWMKQTTTPSSPSELSGSYNPNVAIEPRANTAGPSQSPPAPAFPFARNNLLSTSHGEEFATLSSEAKEWDN
jgi:hypothetical protein